MCDKENNMDYVISWSYYIFSIYFVKKNSNKKIYHRYSYLNVSLFK